MLINQKAIAADTKDDVAIIVTQAIEIIDKNLGAGYARKNPMMIASVAQTLAIVRETNFKMRSNDVGDSNV